MAEIRKNSKISVRKSNYLSIVTFEFIWGVALTKDGDQTLGGISSAGEMTAVNR
ncbi:hypothetical protein [Paenibacillus tepidiphilus]|uniref:hypothetical protein n=1 Tax=Paenibacillus tepidiphilus TaxID=2608683 RepID=UPI0013A54795|nr:hypothetical protein [Paenibacillus tepidiphilus]